jgi:capsular polysaccharide biosynthesis protein
LLTTIIENKKGKHWRSLIKLGDFTKSRQIETIQLDSDEDVDTPTPRVFPERDQDHLISPNDRYNFPSIYVAILNKGTIYGGTNLALIEDVVICHDLFDCERDYTSEELHGRTLIDIKRKRIRWLLIDEKPESIPIAASFVDACASNYAHWLTEVLPRIAMFCSEKLFCDVPIIVNDGLHKNITDSLFLLVGKEREIIFLPVDRALSVKKLYLTSVAGYVPFERRRNSLSGHSHGKFKPKALELLRNNLNKFAENYKQKISPEKIYLRRNFGPRKIINTAELERLIIDRGYIIIEPGELTFLQQLILFNNAKKIIAPTGASLSSVIFSKPGTQVSVLMAKHEEMIYRYWYDILNPLKINLKYVLGEIVENRHLGIHGDFIVNPDDFIDALEEMDNK